MNSENGFKGYTKVAHYEMEKFAKLLIQAPCEGLPRFYSDRLNAVWLDFMDAHIRK